MITQEYFEDLIVDKTKYIKGDIIWDKNKRNPPAFEFRVDIMSDPSYPILVKGWYNYWANNLSYTIIHTDFGGQRIYGLDLGQNHQNPDGMKVGIKHKHRWKNEHFKGIFIGDKKAYIPEDITASVTDPIGVWKQFCLESQITHDGIMYKPQIPELNL